MIEYGDNTVVLTGGDAFSPEKTFLCGQCFRFEAGAGGEFTGIARGRYLRVGGDAERTVLYCGKAEFEAVWRGYFDADSLYEGALRDGTLQFDWETFSSNPARLRIQAFERDTGRTVRFGREDMTDPMRMIDLIRASSTLPGMMKPLEVDGSVLMDGGLGAGAGIPLGMAEDDGFERFVFVATRPRGYRKKQPGARDRQMYKAVTRDHPYLRNALLTRWERYNAALDHVEELAEKGQALVIYPDEMPVENATVNPRRLAAAYDAGHAQYLREMPRLREFLFGSASGGPRPEDPDQGTGYITLG